jgi:hypothetical protein
MVFNNRELAEFICRETDYILSNGDLGNLANDAAARRWIYYRVTEELKRVRLCTCVKGWSFESFYMFAEADIRAVVDLFNAIISSGITFAASAISNIVSPGRSLRLGTERRGVNEFSQAQHSDDNTVVVSKFMKTNRTELFAPFFGGNRGKSFAEVIVIRACPTSLCPENVGEKVMISINNAYENRKNKANDGGITRWLTKSGKI